MAFGQTKNDARTRSTTACAGLEPRIFVHHVRLPFVSCSMPHQPAADEQYASAQETKKGPASGPVERTGRSERSVMRTLRRPSAFSSSVERPIRRARYRRWPSARECGGLGDGLIGGRVMSPDVRCHSRLCGTKIELSNVAAGGCDDSQTSHHSQWPCNRRFFRCCCSRVHVRQPWLSRLVAGSQKGQTKPQQLGRSR